MRLEGRVMLVEDEPRVRKVTGEMLELLGLEVSLFGDGKSAADHFRDHHESVDLVLLDMVMPEQSGRETFAVLRAIDPKVPIVIMSGYSQDGDAQSLIDAGAAGFLQKPFSMAQLAAQVRNGLRR